MDAKKSLLPISWQIWHYRFCYFALDLGFLKFLAKCGALTKIMDFIKNLIFLACLSSFLMSTTISSTTMSFNRANTFSLIGFKLLPLFITRSCQSSILSLINLHSLSMTRITKMETNICQHQHCCELLLLTKMMRKAEKHLRKRIEKKARGSNGEKSMGSRNWRGKYDILHPTYL